MTPASTGAPEHHLASVCSSPNMDLCKYDSCVSVIKTHNDHNRYYTCKLCFFFFTHNNVQHEAFPFYVRQHEQFFQSNNSACWDDGCWIKHKGSVHNIMFIILKNISQQVSRLLSEQKRKECVCISQQEEQRSTTGEPLYSIFALQSDEMASCPLEFHVSLTVVMHQCNDYCCIFLLHFLLHSVCLIDTAAMSHTQVKSCMFLYVLK